MTARAAPEQGPPDASPCPESETLAAFIDGRTRGGTRMALLLHLDECQACFDIVLDAHRFVQGGRSDAYHPWGVLRYSMWREAGHAPSLRRVPTEN